MTDTLHPSVLWAMGGIVAVLVIATVTVWVIDRVKPGLDLDELRARIRSWWIMAAVFFVALAFTKKISLVFFALVSFLALKEYLSLLPDRPSDKTLLALAYASIPIQYWWIGTEWYGMFIIFVPVYMFLALPTRLVLLGDTERFLRRVGTLHWGLMVTVFAVGHVAYLLMLPATTNPNGGGAALVLYLVVLTQGNDVAQFLWGKSLGRKRIVPTVSPNKTWAGFLGGAGTTLAIGVPLASLLTPFPLHEAVAATLIIGVGGFVGDIIISAVKRDLGIKDAGTLLPGHGGILDRIDSLVFTAPIFFHFTRYLHGG